MYSCRLLSVKWTSITTCVQYIKNRFNPGKVKLVKRASLQNNILYKTETPATHSTRPQLHSCKVHLKTIKTMTSEGFIKRLQKTANKLMVFTNSSRIRVGIINFLMIIMTINLKCCGCWRRDQVRISLVIFGVWLRVHSCLKPPQTRSNWI